MTAAGIVVALPAEARTLGCQAWPVGKPIRLGERAWLVLSGSVGPTAAVAAAERLLNAGAGALVSWGTAGALDPGLAAGELLIPERILDSNGMAYDCDAGWRRRACAGLGESVNMRGGTLLQSPVLAPTALDKRRLFEHFNAVGVDMESAALACLAQQCKVPFLAVRAITDTASTDIPSIVAAALDSGGRLSLLRLLRNACLRPGDLPGLFTLGGHFRVARRTLQRLAGSAASGFFLLPDGVWVAGQGNVRVSPRQGSGVRGS